MDDREDTNGEERRSRPPRHLGNDPDGPLMVESQGTDPHKIWDREQRESASSNLKGEAVGSRTRSASTRGADALTTADRQEGEREKSP